MTAANQQILSAFEAGLTPEQIAESLSYEVAAVKAILMQHNASFRKDVKNDPTKITDDEAVQIKEALLSLALYSEDEHVKLKTLIYLRDDHRGRHDRVAVGPSLNIPVLVFNQQVQKALSAMERAAKQVANKVAPHSAQIVDV